MGFFFFCPRQSSVCDGRTDAIDHELTMGRNKDAEPLTKRERKLKKEGLLTTARGTKSYMGRERACTMRRTGIDTRRPVQTSNDSNWLHAVGFVVLAAIVISWALGY